MNIPDLNSAIKTSRGKGEFSRWMEVNKTNFLGMPVEFDISLSLLAIHSAFRYQPDFDRCVN